MSERELPELEMPQRVDADPEEIMRKVMGFHAPGGKYPYSEDGRWPHEQEYDEATEQHERDGDDK